MIPCDMAKADNQPPDDATQRLAPSATQSEESKAYFENWSVKYAEQIAACNEMIERDGLWSDGLRMF
jgi:post-segregation antitoxin (ccd killing protein)